MKTVGEILKNTRLQKNLQLKDISAQTRIAVHYLEAIEANDFKALPAATFTKGFLRNYATNLSLDPNTVLAIFRRDYDQDERGRIVPRGLTEPVKAPFTIITPTRLSLGLSLIIGLVIVGFFLRQIFIFTQAPPLEITAPLDNTHVLSPVSITGKTNPEASVTINKEPATVNPDGTFSQDLELQVGDHTLVIVASSRGGNKRTLQKNIYVDSPSNLPPIPTPGPNP